MSATFNAPALRIPQEISLPDNDQWQFRFEVKSESSGSIYIIAQNKVKKHWGCSCFGYRRFRRCKHLESMGIPTGEQPFQPKIIR